MKRPKPDTRTGAAEPKAMAHLSSHRKQALDLGADAEHTDGSQREKQTREIERLGGASKKSR